MNELPLELQTFGKTSCILLCQVLLTVDYWGPGSVCASQVLQLHSNVMKVHHVSDCGEVGVLMQ